MDDQWRDHPALRKAAALHNLGGQVGAGAGIWARTARDELTRHQQANDRWPEHPDRETWERLHGSALAIVVAIHQVLSFERQVTTLTGDPELAEARRRFDDVVPDAAAVRDLVAHMDAY